MRGEIDTSFVTNQRDLFTSGMAAQIGMNAFGVWLAIKSHADYNTGHAWPGMRLLGRLTGLSLGAVQKCVKTLVEAKLLRVIEEGKGKRTARYIPRERLDVRLGSRVVCTIVVDYVPARLRERLERIEAHMTGKKDDPDAIALATIIPGLGFVWDDKAGELRADIKTSELPPAVLAPNDETQLKYEIQRRVVALRDKDRNRSM